MDVIAEDERFAAMLLSRVGYYHLQEIRTLYTMVGSAQAVVAPPTTSDKSCPTPLRAWCNCCLTSRTTVSELPTNWRMWRRRV